MKLFSPLMCDWSLIGLYLKIVMFYFCPIQVCGKKTGFCSSNTFCMTLWLFRSVPFPSTWVKSWTSPAFLSGSAPALSRTAAELSNYCPDLSFTRLWTNCSKGQFYSKLKSQARKHLQFHNDRKSLREMWKCVKMSLETEDCCKRRGRRRNAPGLCWRQESCWNSDLRYD